MQTKKNEKKRYWAFVVYPESAPENWIELLETRGVVGCISPLHDRDIDPTGERKKSHWHVILCWTGPQTYNVVNGLSELVNGANPIPLEHLKGYYRYLTHKDNPEKAQYDEKDIVNLNGFRAEDFIELSRSEVQKKIELLMNIIVENDFTEYAQLLDFLREWSLKEEFNVACNHTIMFNAYLQSRRYMKQKTKPA